MHHLAWVICWLIVGSFCAAGPPKFSQQTDGWLSAWPPSTWTVRPEPEGTKSVRPLLVVAREDDDLSPSLSSSSSMVQWSKQWKVFGPLPAADQVSDPLEAVGGIWKAVQQPDLRVVSELVDGAYVGWQVVEGTTLSGDHADQGDLTQGGTIRFGVNFTAMVNRQLLDSYFGQAG